MKAEFSIIASWLCQSPGLNWEGLRSCDLGWGHVGWYSCTSSLPRFPLNPLCCGRSPLSKLRVCTLKSCLARKIIAFPQRILLTPPLPLPTANQQLELNHNISDGPAKEKRDYSLKELYWQKLEKYRSWVCMVKGSGSGGNEQLDKEEFIKRAFSHDIEVPHGKDPMRWCHHTTRITLGSLEKIGRQIGLLYQSYHINHTRWARGVSMLTVLVIHLCFRGRKLNLQRFKALLHQWICSSEFWRV